MRWTRAGDVSGDRVRKILTASAVAVAVIFFMFPLYWAVTTSLKPLEAERTDLWLPWVTFEPTLAGWQRLFGIPGLASATFNSIIVSAAGATLALLLAAPIAYAVGRLRFPRGWAAGMLLLFFLLRLLPPAVFLPPYLQLLSRIGLVDTLAGLIVINASFNLPLAAIILAGAFREIPRDLEEAAWVDGVGRWGSFARICVPLVAPALAASWLICLAFIWNEWMYASALGYTNARTLPMMIQSSGGADTTRALAATAVPIVAALFAQRYMVRALSLGAVKG
jgi:multiple sugar transport system permease protein